MSLLFCEMLKLVKLSYLIGNILDFFFKEIRLS